MKKRVSDLMEFINVNDLSDAMPELFRLYVLILTISSTTASVERSFSALKRIKTYQRNTTGENRISGLCLIFFFFFFYFNLYIYPPDSQESDGGAIHRVSNYPDLLPEMPRYCCPLVS